MTTKRRPVAMRKHSLRISERAVSRFRQMRKLPLCRCTYGPAYYDHVECAACEQWTELQNQLHTELGLFVGDYPAVSNSCDIPLYVAEDRERA